MTRAQAAERLRTLEARIITMVRAFHLLALTAKDERLKHDADNAAYHLLDAADKVVSARVTIDRKAIT